MIPLPEDFLKRMSQQLGSGMQDFLDALSQPPVRGIRINSRKPFEGLEVYTSGDRIPWCGNGYILKNDSPAGQTIFHEAGAFYLQEPAAMLPAEVMDVKPGETVLDLCAAPGGKSTQMALKMEGEGLIVCNEPSLKRAQILSRNIERMGITNSIVTCSYPERLPGSWNEQFDGVLVDAPCSGEGMFRRDPQTRSEWTEKQAAGCAERQARILLEASRFVRPGGRIVYSTCTYNPMENELNIEAFLRNHQDFSLEPFSLSGIRGRDGMFLCMPHLQRGEGQFVAKLRKKGTGGDKRLVAAFPGITPADLKKLTEQFPGILRPNCRFGDVFCSAPEAPDMNGVKVLRAGLHIAAVKEKNIVPDHAAALSVFPADVPFTEMNSDEAKAYIAGEEIPLNTSGWTVMRYKGLNIGWGKGSNGRIRNHYPKGLRKRDIETASA